MDNLKTAIALEEGVFDLSPPVLIWVTLKSLTDLFDPCFFHI